MAIQYNIFSTKHAGHQRSMVLNGLKITVAPCSIFTVLAQYCMWNNAFLLSQGSLNSVNSLHTLCVVILAVKLPKRMMKQMT